MISSNSCKKELILNETANPLIAKQVADLKKNSPNVTNVTYLDFLNRVNVNNLGILKSMFVNDGKQLLMSTESIAGLEGVKIIKESMKLLSKDSIKSYVFLLTNTSVPKNSFQNLTIKVELGKTTAFTTTYNPTDRWINAKSDGKRIPFEGSTSSKKINLEGSVSGLFNMSEGVRKYSSTNPVKQSVAYYDPDCIPTVSWDYVPYYCSSGNHLGYTEECAFAHPDEYPDGYPGGSTYQVVSVTDCEEGGNNPTSPIDPPSQEHGSSGGNGGGQNTANMANRDIIVTARDCVTNIKNGLLNAASQMTKVNSILSEYSTMCNGIDVDYTFNTSKALLALNSLSTVYVQEGDLPYDVPSSKPDGSIAYVTKHGTTVASGNITLNEKSLAHATDLGVAAILAHELMHSYFLWGAYRLTGNEKRAFQDINSYLFDKDYNPIPQNSQLAATQHLALGLFYIDSMAGLLKTFANSKGIVNSPDSNITLEEYCKDLIWALLEDGVKLNAPNSSRVKSNGEKEFKNTSSSTHVKGC